jgi:FtsP/CotA-like multicopper oxidase with cupredoxin domain
MYSRRGFLILLLALIVGLVQITYADTVIHDEAFIPDAILHVSEKLVKQSCVPEKDILVVNGTSPGPKLEFTEGQTVWIRVYNDVADQNLTMVSACFFLPLIGVVSVSILTTILALARPYIGNRPIL